MPRNADLIKRLLIKLIWYNKALIRYFSSISQWYQVIISVQKDREIQTAKKGTPTSGEVKLRDISETSCGRSLLGL